jgi:hypothetical protein
MNVGKVPADIGRRHTNVHIADEHVLKCKIFSSHSYSLMAKPPPGGKPGKFSGSDGDSGPPGKRWGSSSDDNDDFRVFRDGGDDDGNPVPKTQPNTAIGITKILTTIGGVIGAVFLLLKMLPKVVSDTLFGWLPEEYREPLCSSCCCSCCALSALAAIGAAMSYAT